MDIRRRLEKRIYCMLPNWDARKQLITTVAQNFNFSFSDDEIEKLNLQSELFTVPDLKMIVEDAFI